MCALPTVSPTAHPTGTHPSSDPRRRQSAPHEALAGGGSGSISGGGKDWGSGGGGSGGGGGADDSSASDAAGPGWMQGWRERVAYDPEFPFKVLLEQVLGLRVAWRRHMAKQCACNQSRMHRASAALQQLEYFAVVAAVCVKAQYRRTALEQQ